MSDKDKKLIVHDYMVNGIKVDWEKAKELYRRVKKMSDKPKTAEELAIRIISVIRKWQDNPGAIFIYLKPKIAALIEERDEQKVIEQINSAVEAKKWMDKMAELNKQLQSELIECKKQLEIYQDMCGKPISDIVTGATTNIEDITKGDNDGK